MKTSLSALAIGLIAMPSVTFGGLTINLNEDFKDGEILANGITWLSVALSDNTDDASIGTDQVKFELSAPNIPSGAFVDWWLFNYNRAFDLSFQVSAVSGVNVAIGNASFVSSGLTGEKSLFDFEFDLPNGSVPGSFGVGDTITLLATRSGGAPLVVSDFLVPTDDPRKDYLDGFFTAAHVGGLANGQSDKIGGKAYGVTAIPEPNSMLFGLTGLFGVLLLTRRRRS